MSVLTSAGSSSGVGKSDAADRSSGPRIVRHLQVGGMVRLFLSPSDPGSTGPDSPPANSTKRHQGEPRRSLTLPVGTIQHSTVYKTQFGGGNALRDQ